MMTHHLKSGHGDMGDESCGYRMMVMGLLDMADMVMLSLAMVSL